MAVTYSSLLGNTGESGVTNLMVRHSTSTVLYLLHLELPADVLHQVVIPLHLLGQMACHPLVQRIYLYRKGKNQEGQPNKGLLAMFQLKEQI